MHVNYQSELAAVRADWLVWCAAGLLFVAILIGGGGAEAPLLNGLLAAGGAILLCVTAARHFTGRPLPSAAIVPLLFLVALLLLVLAQLIPLPPASWNALPGREAVAAVYALIDQDGASHPLSLDPEATRRFAAALLLPAGLFFAALHANRNGLIIMARAIVLGATLSAILAAAQFVMGLPPGLFPYGAPGAAVTTGLFANPNHQAQLMLAAIVMCGVLIHFSPPRPRRPRRRSLPFHPVWMLLPLFMAGAIMTQSRAGMLLLVPALIAAVLIAVRRRGLARVFALSVIAIPLFAVMIALFPGGLARGAEIQMELSAGGRITNLPDILFTLQQFWPWGSGFGTFVPVFKINENLDLMGDAYVNHAHNDLAEILIEGGLPMAVLLGVALLALAVRLWRLVASRHSSDPATALAGLTIIFLALVHSMFDYPLRMQGLAGVIAIALAFFLSPSPNGEHGPGTSPRHRDFDVDHEAAMGRASGTSLPRLLIFGPLLLVGAAIGIQAVMIGLGQAAVRAKNGATAAQMRPQNGWGLALLAESQFEQGRTAEAMATSRAAIEQTPLDVVAVRTLARAQDKLHGPGAGEKGWQAASLLGWRDKPVQVWAAFRALSNGQSEIFAMRADALLRTGDPDELMTRFIRQAVVQPEIRKAFVARLATDPPWRTRFFQAEVPPSGRALQGVVAVLNDLKAMETSPTRQELRDAVMGLIKARRYKEAASLDRRYVRRSPDQGSLIDDGGFELEESDYQLRATPFDWAIDPRAAAVEQVAGSRHVVVFADGSPDPALRRFLALPPGPYRLEFATSGPPDTGRTLRFAAACAATGAKIGESSDVTDAGEGRQEQAFEFNVPADCGLVELTLRRVQPGSADGLVDDVRLQRT